jgi:hypothetical protein
MCAAFRISLMALYVLKVSTVIMSPLPVEAITFNSLPNTLVHPTVHPEGGLPTVPILPTIFHGRLV